MTDGEGRPWDWHDDADDVIVPDQPPVACYVNPKGAVVLRQRDDWPSDDDPIIWFAVEHAPAVAAAILDAAGIDATALAPEPAQVASKAKDPTGAERQQRRRRKKKESTPDIFDRDDRDGDRDTVTRDGLAAL